MAVPNCHCSFSAPWLTPLSQSCPELPRRPPSSPVHGSDLRLLSMIDYSYWQYVLDRVMLVEQKTDTIFPSLGWSSRTLRPSTSLCITTLPYSPQHVSKQLQSTSMYPITYFASHLPGRRFTVLRLFPHYCRRSQGRLAQPPMELGDCAFRTHTLWIPCRRHPGTSLRRSRLGHICTGNDSTEVRFLPWVYLRK